MKGPFTSADAASESIVRPKRSAVRGHCYTSCCGELYRWRSQDSLSRTPRDPPRSEERCLHAVLQSQPLLQRYWELLSKPLPVLFSNLLFEAVQDPVEHLFEVGLGVNPRGDGITEEDKVFYHSGGIDADHVAHTTEGGVLLLVVADIAQRDAPLSDKLLQERGDICRANIA